MAESGGVLADGRYRLLSRIGMGGMGVVWRARDEYLNRDVAIKEVLLPAGSEDSASLQRALREARAAAALRHRGIVTIYDVIIHDQRPWIVMELVKGLNLAETIKRDGPLSEQRAAEIGFGILDALAAAHENGILHRDVKPANILLDGDHVVLTDFGIATVVGNTALTRTGELIGSPDYIAPERILGHEVTAAADLWAVGITLYTCVTGTPPFNRADTQASLAAVLTQEPVPLKAPKLWPAIKGLLVKAPADRSTLPRAQAQLGKVLDHDRTTQSIVVKKVVRKRPWQAISLALVALLAAGGLFVWLYNQQDTPTGTSAPPTATTTTRTPPAGFRFHDDNQFGFSIAVPSTWRTDTSPSQTRVVFVGDSPACLLYVKRIPPGSYRDAGSYLNDLAKSESSSAAHKRIALTATDLEYTNEVGSVGNRGFGQSNAPEHHRIRAIQTKSSQLYTVELLVQSAKQADWDKARAPLDTILGSFQAG